MICKIACCITAIFLAVLVSDIGAKEPEVLSPDLSYQSFDKDTQASNSSEEPSILDGIKKAESDTLPEAKAWALGCAAVLSERNHQRHDSLALSEMKEKNIVNQKNSLEEWWGVSDRASFFNTLEWIDKSGHRKRFNELAEYIDYLSEQGYEKLLEEKKGQKETLNEIRIVKEYYKELGEKTLLGWDYSRYIHLCRCAYMIGYITEEEAWNLIMPIADMLQKTFDSWEDLGNNYVIGRKFWSYQQTEKSGYLYEDACQRLIDMPSSPWNRYPWNTKLQNAPPASDTDVKTQ